MAQVNFRIDDEIKREADALFKRLGMNMSVAITVFLNRAIQTQGIPFPVQAAAPLGDDELLRRIDDVKNGRNCHYHDIIEVGTERIPKVRRTAKRRGRSVA